MIALAESRSRPSPSLSGATLTSSIAEGAGGAVEEGVASDRPTNKG